MIPALSDPGADLHTVPGAGAKGVSAIFSGHRADV
jgi:hypothetical protein